MPLRDVMLSWSSGKDSAWTLRVLRQTEGVRVRGLLTTVNRTHQRVAMHAVRRRLLALQARSLGLPLVEVELPHPCTNEDYERVMGQALERLVDEGVSAVAFGDLFLEDVRAYRERQLEAAGLEGLYPLWGRDTTALAREMIDGGLRARLTCVDPRQCPADFAGREYDASLLSELPASVDPCGENGEFHTFVNAGPMFSAPIAVTAGEVVEREGFVFADLVPAEDAEGES